MMWFKKRIKYVVEVNPDKVRLPDVKGKFPKEFLIILSDFHGNYGENIKIHKV